MIVAEKLARVASFAVSYGGHSGIGTLPIVYFGTEEQKRKYLPLLCKADKISAYALSEAGGGSDALAAKTTAVRSSDGSSLENRDSRIDLLARKAGVFMRAAIMWLY